MTGDVLEEANNYATQEALRATYRDFTEIGNWLSKVKNVGPNASVPKKAGAVAVESMIPFAKTPINILRRGIDYSPIGLISGTGKLVKAVKAGDNKLVSEAIDRMSAGLTGTGIFGLGLALNQMGIITTDLGSDANRHIKW